MCINCFCDKKVSKSFFRLSRNFSDHQDRKVSTLSKNFPGCPKTIQKISRLSGNFTGYQQLSGPSGKYPDYPESFQAIWKFSRLPGNFPDYPWNIQAIWKLSRLSRIFPGYLEIFQAIRKLFGKSGKYLSRLFWNFSDSPETFQTDKKWEQWKHILRELNIFGGTSKIPIGHFWHFLLEIKSDRKWMWYLIIADISRHCNNQWWCTFFKPVPF